MRYILPGRRHPGRGIWSDNMSKLDRSAYATLAFMALASLAGIAPVHAQGENSRESHEQQPSEAERQAARREAEARQSRRTHPARAQNVHTAPRQEPSYAREHPVVNEHGKMVGHSINEGRLADGSVVREVSRSFAGGQVRVVRYGNTLSGTVERTIRPGLISRTFVGGGHVLYTHVYQRHVWYQSGRAFAYETFVPAVRYPAVYYAWALAPWPRPVTYTWGWQVQPWYPMYGSRFTPYVVYTSPDLWMTDYIIAQSLQTAYQAQTAAPASEPSPQGAPAAPAADSGVAAPAARPSGPTPAPQPRVAPLGPQSIDMPPAPVALPPAITPQVKAQLNAQIKVQLQEQQAAAATPVSLTTQNTPPALRPNHVFFQVVQPLEVPSGTANHYCSLSPDDYIKRTGEMSNDDWAIPVVIELSGPSDCPAGLRTRIGLNDLNAMENEQEAQVMEAMQAVSKSMRPNGPPSGPGAHPTLIADGSAAPDPMALDAIRQAQ
jgi:hypothetical protein